MDNSLDSILSEEPSDPGQAAEQEQPTAETQVEQQEQATDTGEEQGTGEETGTPPEPQKEDQLEKHRKGLEAAAAAERKKRQDAEARAAQAEAQLRALQEAAQRQPQQQQERQQPDADPKPLRSQFETEDEWLDARDEWRDRQRERESAIEKAQREAQDLYVKTESIYAQAQALEGFDRARFDALPLSKPIVQALVDSDNAPALMHFMAANPAEVVRIAGLSDARQIKEMARIEDKLAAPKQEEETPPEKKEVRLPETLTQARDVKGRFTEQPYSGPTPLNAILATK